MLLFLIDE
uniref:Uncharacterized protein n=1 Tax=Rhizophora mucronata TaxID=61149 RepID=A0A2P2P5V0_RHIMU